MRLRYWPVGEELSGSAPPPALEESGTWSLGVAAVVAVALVVGGAEELPATAAGIAGEEAGWQAPPASPGTIAPLTLGQEELPAVVTVALEEDGWVARVVVTAAVPLVVAGAEELPYAASEEWGEVPARAVPPPLATTIPTGEELPVTVVAGPGEEDAGPAWRPAEVGSAPLIWAGEECPASVAAALEEGGWTPASGTAAVVGRLPEVGEELPAAAAAALEESGDPSVVARSVSPVAGVVVGAEEVPVPLVPISAEETGYHPPRWVVLPAGPVAMAWEEVPSEPVVAAVVVGTGKYKPEHDGALVDLRNAVGFQAEHDGALADLRQATGFQADHDGALSDLRDAGI